MKYTLENIVEIIDNYNDFYLKLHKFSNQVAKLLTYNYSTLPDSEELYLHVDTEPDSKENYKMFLRFGLDDRWGDITWVIIPMEYFINDEVVETANYIVNSWEKEKQKRIEETRRQEQEQIEKAKINRYKEYLKLKEEFEDKNGSIN